MYICILQLMQITGNNWCSFVKMVENKIALIEYLQERICFYANSNDTPAEQIKGMNRLLRDVINMPNEFFEVQE